MNLNAWTLDFRKLRLQLQEEQEGEEEKLTKDNGKFKQRLHQQIETEKSEMERKLR